MWAEFEIAAILNFVSTSNFISIHCPSIYKLSMIRFVHKVHFDVGFQIDFTLFSHDNLIVVVPVIGIH